MVTAIVDRPLAGASETVVCATSFMPAKKQQILNQKIIDFPFTEDFKSFTRKHGFITIGEMVDFPVAKLMELDGFTFHSLQEFVQFLEKRDMANLLKE